VPKKFSKQQIDRGKKELLAIKGLDKTTFDTLSRAGIINATLLLEADPATLAAETGIMAHVIQDFQKAIKRKRDTAIIQI
jgi:hypothetical protein